MPFVEAEVRLDTLVKRIEPGGVLAGHAARLATDPFVARIEALNEAFGRELEVAKRPSVTWPMILEARAHPHHRLIQLIATVVGPLRGDTESEQEQRTLVIEPIARQQRIISSRHRNRRGVRDVDPLSGGELSDPQAVDAVADPRPEPLSLAS